MVLLWAVDIRVCPCCQFTCDLRQVACHLGLRPTCERPLPPGPALGRALRGGGTSTEGPGREPSCAKALGQARPVCWRLSKEPCGWSQGRGGGVGRARGGDRAAGVRPCGLQVWGSGVVGARGSRGKRRGLCSASAGDCVQGSWAPGLSLGAARTRAADGLGARRPPWEGRARWPPVLPRPGHAQGSKGEAAAGTPLVRSWWGSAAGWRPEAQGSHQPVPQLHGRSRAAEPPSSARRVLTSSCAVAWWTPSVGKWPSALGSPRLRTGG